MRCAILSEAGRICIVCGVEELGELVRIPSVPVVCNQLLHNPAKAQEVPRASIDLVRCHSCGHIFNLAFDPGLIDYDPSYENSLMGSSRYRQYSESIIERLLSVYGLKHGSAVEIGCGRGEFLRMLCERGM